MKGGSYSEGQEGLQPQNMCLLESLMSVQSKMWHMSNMLCHGGHGPRECSKAPRM